MGIERLLSSYLTGFPLTLQSLISQRGYLVKTNIQWKNLTKTGVSMFVGTSPELELALYTVCFFCRPDQLCKVKLNGNLVDIQTYHHNWYDKTLVASAFPVL